MKSKDIKSLQDKTQGELAQMTADLKSELFSLRLDKSQNKLKNQRSIFIKRKDMARVLSVLREKELKDKDESERRDI